MKNAEIAEKILAFMLGEIKHHDIKLMEKHPTDMTGYTLNYLKHICTDEIQFAWVVGDIHTHIVALGIHSEDNKMIKCFMNLSIQDKFYLFKVNKDGSFLAKQLKKNEFEKLSEFPVMYNDRNLSNNSFDLYKGEVLIAKCKTLITGNSISGIVKKGIYTLENKEEASKIDETAAHQWISHRLTKMAGYLTGSYDIQKSNPI